MGAKQGSKNRRSPKKPPRGTRLGFRALESPFQAPKALIEPSRLDLFYTISVLESALRFVFQPTIGVASGQRIETLSLLETNRGGCGNRESHETHYWKIFESMEVW